MREIRLIGIELHRLLQARRTWFFIAIYVLAPVLCATDMFGLASSYTGGMASVLILMPAKRAVIISIFGTILLALSEMSRVQHNHMDSILNAATSPIRRTIRQTVAFLLVTIVGFLMSMTIVFPYTAIKMADSFRLIPFASVWGGLYWGGIVTALLLTCGVFLFSNNFNFSFLAVCGLTMGSVALSFSASSYSFLLFWVQTTAFALSDATYSWLQLELIFYVRLAWLCTALTVYILGLCATRRYGLGLWRSLMLSVRRVVPAAIVLGLAVAVCMMIVNQPYFDNGPIFRYRPSVDPETGIVVYVSDDDTFRLDDGGTSAVRISKPSADITVDTRQGIATGIFTCNILNPAKTNQDLAFSINPGLDFAGVTLDGQPISYQRNQLDNFQESVYHLDIPHAKGELKIVYGGQPKDSRGNGSQTRMYGITREFVFLPHMFPTVMNDYQAVECVLHLPEELMPLISDVNLKQLDPLREGYSAYSFNGYGYEWLFAGDYIVEEFEAGGLDVQFVYLKGRQQVMQDAKASATVADIINYFSETIGPLRFGSQPMVIAELDGSFVTGGWGLGRMSVFGESMFMGTVYKASEAAGSNEGGQGIGVAVHEIAHQWWGWSPSGVNIGEEENTPWSGEGLTVYSTYLYMKSRYGEDYARAHFTDVWRENTQRMQNAFYLNHLEYASNLPEAEAASIYSAFASTTRYDMMPLLLLKAEELSGGEDAFIQKLRDIHMKYRGQVLSYNQFLKELGLTKEEMMLE